MLLSYKSDYPNQVHQLNISISKNHYVLKNGDIKYQAKKFDINWKNYKKTGKNHLVNFLIRDHYSNCFYAEIHQIDSLPYLKDFLFNAWKTKDKFEFCGIPKNLIVGKMIIQDYPEINNFSRRIGCLNIELAKSGFATGIRSVRDWENCIKYYSGFRNYSNIKDFQCFNEKICREYNMLESGKTEQNLKKWALNNPQGFLVDDKNRFDKLFTK